MAKLPRRPDLTRLACLPPPVKTLPAGTLLWRVYFRGGPHPVDWCDLRYFGPLPHSRFDHHRPDADGLPQLQARGILYAGEDARTCFAEAFQQTRVIDRAHKRPWLVAWKTAGALALLDLTGIFPTQAGASMALMTGPRTAARAWAQGFYESYPALHGLYYPSSMHANQPAIAFTERSLAAGAWPTNPAFHHALADETLLTVLRNAARDLGYGLS